MIRRLPLAGILACSAALATSPAPANEAFPEPTNNQEVSLIPFTPPEDTIGMMRLPPGFQATLFAAEPAVQNPIAMCWDERGRLWVAENYTYSDRLEEFDLSLRDRIIILEDSDNDGRFDKRTVFADDLQRLTSIERGFGGVFAMCPPHLLFIPEDNDRAIGPPEILLDGFRADFGLRHTVANGLKWGPDGWLYGRVGITGDNWAGVPGTPNEDRQPTGGGIWRYHPVRKVYEPYSHGTTNPWGHDWNKHGDQFFINTVIGHLWHSVYGAHYERMGGSDPSPHLYSVIGQHADHYHWDTGQQWTESRDNAGPTADLGGGHAHVGMMIYQGTNFPPQYRDRLFTANLHGRRLNVDRLDRHGSGYVGRHEDDFLFSDDPWIRVVEVSYGPDGGVYLLDWSDIGECHENDGVHRTSGRIYKITYSEATRPPETDLPSLSDSQLVELQLSENEWLVRMSRWELRERQFRGTLSPSIHDELEAKIASHPNYWRTLSYLGTLPTAEAWREFLDVAKNRTRLDEIQRGQLFRLGFINAPQSVIDERFAEGAPGVAGLADRIASEPSAYLRLHWASLLQRLPLEARLRCARGLAAHAEDSSDHNLPLMLWFGIKDAPPERLAELFPDSRLPLVSEHIARRVAEEIANRPAALNALLATCELSQAPHALRGVAAALRGLTAIPTPDGWEAFVDRVTPRLDDASLALMLGVGVQFGSDRAIAEAVALVRDASARDKVRRDALTALIDANVPQTRELCEYAFEIPSLHLVAMEGLARFDDPALADAIIDRFPKLDEQGRQRAVQILASRSAFAQRFLERLGSEVPRQAVTPVIARQIRSLANADIAALLDAKWGAIRESSADKQERIKALRYRFSGDALSDGDPSRGRVVFTESCSSCHTLYGEGNRIGPDLTGSGRHDLGYLLENIVDPNAMVSQEDQLVVLTLTDGRVLSGIIAEESANAITLHQIGSKVSVALGEIAQRERLDISMMPEGILDTLSADQFRDLLVYLMTEEQAPLPPDAL